MSTSSPRVWINGDRADDGPAVPALDHGVSVGDGAFEAAKVENSIPFAMSRHHARMDRSLIGLGLPPADRRAVEEGIESVLSDGHIEFGRLRWVVTAGPGPLGSERLGQGLTTIVTAAILPRPPAVTSIAVVPWRRNEMGATVGLKTTSYADNVVALAAAQELGGSEAIFCNLAGHVCEGTGTNIFIVVGEKVITPPLESGLLAGITRELVLEWGRDEGFNIVEDDITLEDLASADEVFITSSTRDVQAVSEIKNVDDIETGAGILPAADFEERSLPAPGPVTTSLAEMFARRASANPDP